MREKVILGLSGGVDSSVAALLLREQGYEVICCFMRSFDTDRSKQECEAAEKLAKVMGLEFVIEDRREDFKREVVEYFINEYISGRTPNPCCICNRKVKWQALLSVAKKQGANFVATGHYAGVGHDESTGRYFIKRADDPTKDQSYALYYLTQEELSHTIMPLHGYSKPRIRELAEAAGLPTAKKADSQEICFIPDGDYASFIKAAGAELREGNIVDMEGRILGRHKGLINYTVGQRKGLGIALGKRMFVNEIRTETNEVVVSDNEDLFKDECFVRDVNHQARDPEDLNEFSAMVKIRYADKGTDALVKPLLGGRAKVSFSSPVRAVTPGQAAVFYDRDGRILGGGMIE